MKLKRTHCKRGRVEIIPLIDTILILLIFYMSFSTFAKSEQRIDYKLPRGAGRGLIDIVVHVRDSQNIFIGENVFTIQALRSQMQAVSPELSVVIEAEPQTQYQDVIGALDACALAKLTKIAFRPLEPTS